MPPVPASCTRNVPNESMNCLSMSFTERQACAVALLAPFADDLGNKGKSGPINMPNTHRQSERSLRHA